MSSALPPRLSKRSQGIIRHSRKYMGRHAANGKLVLVHARTLNSS